MMRRIQQLYSSKIFTRSLFLVVLLVPVSLACAAQAKTPCQKKAGCDVPYDLGEIPFEYSWPAKPKTSRTINVKAGSIASLRKAVAKRGVKVIVPAGTYSGPLTRWGSDIDLIMDNDAVLKGGIDMNRVNRIRWTGGRIITNQRIIFVNSNDILLDNINIQARSILPGFGPSGSRIAFVRLTAKATRYAWFTQGSNQASRWNYTDLIIANSNLEGGYPSGEEATVRWQRVNRGIIVDSRLWNAKKHTQRSHYGTANIFVRNVQHEGGNLVMIAATGGVDVPKPFDNIGAHWYYDNSFYSPQPGGGVTIQRCSSDCRTRKYTSMFDGPITVERNVVYKQPNSSGALDMRFPAPMFPRDSTRDNDVLPYKTPTPFSGGADH